MITSTASTNTKISKINPKKAQLRHQVLFSTACLAALTAVAPAFAQETTSDQIVVTGTKIRGAEVVGSATQTIDSQQLQESGKTAIGDYLRELPINFAGGVGISDEVQGGQDAGPAAANLTGGQGINLRGLGALSTLVLVNDRRSAASGQFGDFVDISNIPTSAIDRVEILQDGASALYGSDAVGGVVNFVLKRKIERPITTFKTGTATQGGGTEFFGSQLLPVNWDSGNIILGGEYYHRESVRTTDRDPYSNGSDFSSLGGVDWRSFNAHFSPNTNIYLGGIGSTSGASPVGATVPTGASASLTGADLLPVTDGVGNTVNVYDASDILPEVERYSLFLSLDQELAPGIEVFGDFRYTKRVNKSDIGNFALLRGAVSPSSPFYIAGIDPSLTDAMGNIGFGTVFDDVPESRTATVKSINGTAGFRADLFADWQLQSAFSYSSEDQNRRRIQPRGVSVSRLNFLDCALGSANPGCAGVSAIPYNPFSTDPLTQAQIDQYYGFEDLTFNSDLWEITAQVDGTLFSLPSGDVKLAVGGEYRNESIDGFLSETTINPTPSEGPYTATSRNVISVFGEVLIPLHETLDVTVAGRYESFDADYGSEYDDFNPKVGVNFTPIDGLKFRGSWGTSFHAPPMRFENDDPQPIPGGNAAFTLPASRFGPCDSTLVTFNGIIGTPGMAGEQCSFSLIVNSGGAGPGVLKPEEATTWTLGFDYTPEDVPGLTVGMSYFNIEVTDRIQRIQSGSLNGILAEFFATNGGGAFISALNVNPTEAEAQAVLDSAKFLGTFGPPIANTAADIQMIVNATQINIASLKEAGLDFNVSYDFQANEKLDLGFFAYGTYLLKYETQAAPTLAFVDQLGKYSSFGSPVSFRSKQGVRAASGAFDGIVTVNYVNSYECAVGSCYVPGTGGAPTLNSAPVPIDSWVTVDLNLGVDLAQLGSGFLTDGTRVNLNVSNIFDQNPPFVDGGNPGAPIAAAYDPNNHTIVGRTVGLTITKEW